jgi:hypothetical protein
MEEDSLRGREGLVKFGKWKSQMMLVPLAFFALVASPPAVAPGQESSSEPPASAQRQKPASDTIKLSDVTRVSTEKAVQQAAKQKAKDDNATPAESKDAPAASEKESADSSQVTELQPSVKAADDKGTAGIQTAISGDRRTRKIHGSVYGATGPGARATDAEIGAASKSGNTHVYVETGRTVTPQPHQ